MQRLRTATRVIQSRERRKGEQGKGSAGKGKTYSKTWSAADSFAVDVAAVDVAWVVTKPGYMLLDCGCRRSVAGRRWHEEFQRFLEAEFALHPKRGTCEEIFRFGNGQTEVSSCFYDYPVAFLGKAGVLRVSMVETDTPPLFSRSAMASNNLTINFGNNTIVCDGKSHLTETVRGGHLAISLCQWTNKLLATVPAEFIVKAKEVINDDASEFFEKTLGQGQKRLKPFSKYDITAEEKDAQEVDSDSDDYPADCADLDVCSELEFKSVLKRGVKKKLKKFSQEMAEVLMTEEATAVQRGTRSPLPGRLLATSDRRATCRQVITVRWDVRGRRAHESQSFWKCSRRQLACLWLQRVRVFLFRVPSRLRTRWIARRWKDKDELGGISSATSRMLSYVVSLARLGVA